MRAPTLLWLASYPKSGNTWTRIFLANYLLDRPEPVPISEIYRIGASDAGADLYARLAGPGFSASQHQRVLELRPKLLSGIAGNGADLNFVKTHNLKTSINGVPLVPDALTRGAVYILRDPRDVALSYARHFGLTLAKTVANFAKESHTTAGGGKNVKQFLGGWSEHVASWVDEAPFPVHLQRYEDMLSAPEETFAQMLDFIGIPAEPGRLARAVRHSSFGELQRQEAAHGFNEASANSERFFHTGAAGQWRDALPEDLRARLERDHGPLMRRFGYL